jgi:hypothetical protein
MRQRLDTAVQRYRYALPSAAGSQFVASVCVRSGVPPSAYRLARRSFVDSDWICIVLSPAAPFPARLHPKKALEDQTARYEQHRGRSYSTKSYRNSVRDHGQGDIPEIRLDVVVIVIAPSGRYGGIQQTSAMRLTGGDFDLPFAKSLVVSRVRLTRVERSCDCQNIFRQIPDSLENVRSHPCSVID